MRGESRGTGHTGLPARLTLWAVEDEDGCQKHSCCPETCHFFYPYRPAYSGCGRPGFGRPGFDALAVGVGFGALALTPCLWALALGVGFGLLALGYWLWAPWLWATQGFGRRQVPNFSMALTL